MPLLLVVFGDRFGRLAVTLSGGSDKSRSPMLTTVAEHLFDSSSTRRVWHHRSIPDDRKHMNISAELAQIASHGGFFALTVGGDSDGWHPVMHSYADGFADLADATTKRYGSSEARIGASLVHLGHAARLWSPVLACALAHGVIPDLSGLQRADDSAHLRLPEAVGEPGTPSPELLYDIVVRDHMEQLAAGQHTKLAPGLLYGNIASALVGTSRMLLLARPDLRLPITRVTTALLDTGELAGTGEIIDTELGFKRNSCCLFYRLPAAGKCGDCGL